nr:uncharacterized protein LOC126055594 [Helicoverpa armigera]
MVQYLCGICLLGYLRVCLFISMFFVRVLLRSLTTLLTTVSKFFKQFVFAVNTRVPILQLFPKKGRKRHTNDLSGSLLQAATHRRATIMNIFVYQQFFKPYRQN